MQPLFGMCITIYDIEMVQNQAIRFIMNIKGLKDSITVAREQLELETLQDRRKRLKMTLLLIIMRILSKEECHNKSQSATYDELMNDRANHYDIPCCLTWRTHIYIHHNLTLSQQLPFLNCERPEGQNSSYL